jgi:glycosyltransferase involved in cell wall biosynthesis
LPPSIPDDLDGAIRKDGRVRALVVLTQPPLPEGGAPGKVALGLLRGLAAHGVDVQAVAAGTAFSGEPPGDVPVVVVPVPPLSPWRARLGRVTRPRAELAGGELEARVRELARDADVVHLEQPETVWFARSLPAPTVLHVHYLARLDRSLGAPWRRQFREVLDATRVERRAMRLRFLLASSPVVAHELRSRSGAEVTLAPLSLDPALYAQAPLDASKAGLIGTADWPPTADAMRALAEDVWPRVRRLAPEAQLVVAGRGTERLGLGVEVPSAAEFFQRISVLVFPLRRGSGMKVKVLEAMASGVPVVTTPAGAEGIAESDGVVVRAEPTDLARATAELLTDEAARKHRGAAARIDFECRYAPAPATEPIVELYRRMGRALRKNRE